MSVRKESDEYLETLWCLREMDERSSRDFMGKIVGEHDPGALEELRSKGFITVDPGSAAISFTPAGEAYTEKVIRAHRIGERLLHDVLGGEFESGACEFEHIIHTELVDAICTLLGHPRECPHGMSIPEGECCRKSLKMMESPVVPVKDLSPGQSARVAYVSARNERETRLIDGLQIRPGNSVKMLQTYPVFILECEGTTIAVDGEIAANIRVWGDSRRMEARPVTENGSWGRRMRSRWKFGAGGRNRKAGEGPPASG